MLQLNFRVKQWYSFAGGRPLHFNTQDPYGWDTYTEPSSRPAPKVDAGRGARAREYGPAKTYTEDAVDRIFASSARSGSRGNDRDRQNTADSAISKELFSPSAIL